MYDLPINVVVFNNSTLGMVKLEMLVNGLPDFGTNVHDVTTPRSLKLPASMLSA